MDGGGGMCVCVWYVWMVVVAHQLSLTHALIHSLAHSPTHSSTHPPTHSPTHPTPLQCGGVGEWMYREVAGLAPAADGYSRVNVAPHIAWDKVSFAFFSTIAKLNM